MNKLILPKHYISLTGVEDFYNLCKPLLQNTNIDACYYVRLYKDGRYFHLTTDAMLDKYMFFEQTGKYNFDNRILNSIFSITAKKQLCMFTEDIDFNGYWSGLFKDYNINNSFNIIEEFDTYYV